MYPCTLQGFICCFTCSAAIGIYMLILSKVLTHTHGCAANCVHTSGHSHLCAPLQDYPSQPAPYMHTCGCTLHPHRDFDSPTCTHIHKHLRTLLVPSFLPMCVPGRKSTCEKHTQKCFFTQGCHGAHSCARCGHTHSDAQPTVSLVCPSHTLTLVPVSLTTRC